MALKKLVIITGCDSGIGKALCEQFCMMGYTVLISYLEINPFEGNEQVIAQRMDLKVPSDISDFSASVNKTLETGQYQLEGIINNAGVAIGGPFENLSIEHYRELFEVNFFGLISVTQQILPHLIRYKGKIVVIGSLAGRIALPFLSPYAASKFALEGLCDSIRRELTPMGVRCVLIEPGGIATPIWYKADKQDFSFVDQKYSDVMERFLNFFVGGGKKGMKVEESALRIYRIFQKENPRDRYIVCDNIISTHLQLLLPVRFMDFILKRVIRIEY